MERLSYEFVKREFEKEGYKLLSNKYLGAHHKLKYICPKGHKHQISWAKWQQGRRCFYCYGNVKHTINFIKKEFKKENYVLLTKKYRNANQKLDYICSKGHKYCVSWNVWQRGHRCPYCVGVGKPTIEFIKSKFEKEGYKLLTNEYVNSKQKLNYICPKGHYHNISWSNWQQGKRCYYCFGTAPLTIDFIKNEFEKENYKLLTKTYKNAKQKLRYICPNNHKHEITWSDWQSGKRCGICKKFRGYGAQHGCWKGGISCEPYCDVWLDKKYKQSIKDRDGNRCLNPDCWRNCNHLPMHLHHIDDNKKNCDPRNLITVCNSCNSRAKKDREWHTDWYKAIMFRKYSYNI